VKNRTFHIATERSKNGRTSLGRTASTLHVLILYCARLLTVVFYIHSDDTL